MAETSNGSSCPWCLAFSSHCSPIAATAESWLSTLVLRVLKRVEIGLGPARPQRRLIVKFRPLHDRVVVRRLDAEEKTKGGIIIPDTAKEKPQEGEVVAVGP